MLFRSCIDKIDLNPFENPYAELKKVKENEADEENNFQEEKQEDDSEVDILELSNYLINRENLDLQYLKQALNEANNNQRKAAKLLGLSYDQLRGLYRKFSHLL